MKKIEIRFECGKTRRMSAKMYAYPDDVPTADTLFFRALVRSVVVDNDEKRGARLDVRTEGDDIVVACNKPSDANHHWSRVKYFCTHRLDILAEEVR